MNEAGQVGRLRQAHAEQHECHNARQQLDNYNAQQAAQGPQIFNDGAIINIQLSQQLEQNHNQQSQIIRQLESENRPQPHGNHQRRNIQQASQQSGRQGGPQNIPKGHAPYTEPSERHFLGEMNVPCSHCSALHFETEKLTNSSKRHPKFGSCCLQGQIKLPQLQPPPPKLQKLLYGQSLLSESFRNNIHQYNAAFAFTSLGVK